MSSSGTNKRTDMSYDRDSIYEHNFRRTFNFESSTQNSNESLINGTCFAGTSAVFLTN